MGCVVTAGVGQVIILSSSSLPLRSKVVCPQHHVIARGPSAVLVCGALPAASRAPRLHCLHHLPMKVLNTFSKMLAQVLERQASWARGCPPLLAAQLSTVPA